MKLASWQTNLAKGEIEVKSGQIQQVWIVLPTVASVSWKAGQLEHKYKEPAGQWASQKNHFSPFPLFQLSLSVERMFGVPSAEGMSVFQIVPVDRLWLKYTFMEFKLDNALDNLHKACLL